MTWSSSTGTAVRASGMSAPLRIAGATGVGRQQLQVAVADQGRRDHGGLRVGRHAVLPVVLQAAPCRWSPSGVTESTLPDLDAEDPHVRARVEPDRAGQVGGHRDLVRSSATRRWRAASTADERDRAGDQDRGVPAGLHFEPPPGQPAEGRPGTTEGTTRLGTQASNHGPLPRALAKTRVNGARTAIPLLSEVSSRLQRGEHAVQLGERRRELGPVVRDQPGELLGQPRGVEEERVDGGPPRVQLLQQRVAVLDQRGDLRRCGWPPCR